MLFHKACKFAIAANAAQNQLIFALGKALDVLVIINRSHSKFIIIFMLPAIYILQEITNQLYIRYTFYKYYFCHRRTSKLNTFLLS